MCLGKRCATVDATAAVWIHAWDNLDVLLRLDIIYTKVLYNTQTRDRFQTLPKEGGNP